MDYIGDMSASLGIVSEEAKKLRGVTAGAVGAELNETADRLDAAVNTILGSIEGFTAEAMRVRKETQHYGHGTATRRE